MSILVIHIQHLTTHFWSSFFFFFFWHETGASPQRLEKRGQTWDRAQFYSFLKVRSERLATQCFEGGASYPQICLFLVLLLLEKDGKEVKSDGIPFLALSAYWPRPTSSSPFLSFICFICISVLTILGYFVRVLFFLHSISLFMFPNGFWLRELESYGITARTIVMTIQKMDGRPGFLSTAFEPTFSVILCQC